MNIDSIRDALHAVEPKSENLDKKADATDDIRYICKSGALITDALKRGSDVMQLPNGDILITELKTITWHYTWDSEKGVLTRAQAGRARRKHAETVSA